jgi:hypothetical protein
MVGIIFRSYKYKKQTKARIAWNIFHHKRERHMLLITYILCVGEETLLQSSVFLKNRVYLFRTMLRRILSTFGNSTKLPRGCLMICSLRVVPERLALVT